MSHDRPLVEYIISSIMMHLAALLAVLYSPVSLNTPAGGADKIEVNIVEKQKEQKNIRLPPSPRKLLIPRSGAPIVQKEPEGEMKPSEESSGGPPVPIEGYADELKSIIDPVWYAKLRPILPNITKVITTNVLLFLDKYGNVVSVKIIKSSGRKDIDQAALDTFRSIGKLPKPPEVVIKDGIIWDFTISERN